MDLFEGFEWHTAPCGLSLDLYVMYYAFIDTLAFYVRFFVASM
jgi:hypothetical protein